MTSFYKSLYVNTVWTRFYGVKVGTKVYVTFLRRKGRGKKETSFDTTYDKIGLQVVFKTTLKSQRNMP